jgi:hypothetical protein
MGHRDIDEGLAQGYLIVAEKYHLGVVFFEYSPLAETRVTRDHREATIKLLYASHALFVAIERRTLFHPLNYFREGDHDDESLTARSSLREEKLVSRMKSIKNTKNHTSGEGRL